MPPRPHDRTKGDPPPPYASQKSLYKPSRSPRHDSPKIVVPQEISQPDQTVNNPALGSIMHSLGDVLFIRMLEGVAEGASISDQPRDSFVKRGDGNRGFVFTRNWPAIKSGLDEVSRQWTKCGDTLGLKPSMIRSCNASRNNADTLDVYTRAIDPIIRLIPEGSRVTFEAITAKINKLAGSNETTESCIPHQELSHQWSLSRKARNTASQLDCMVVEAMLEIYRQQKEYERATEISGEVPYGSSSKQSSFKV